MAEYLAQKGRRPDALSKSAAPLSLSYFSILSERPVIPKWSFEVPVSSTYRSPKTPHTSSSEKPPVMRAC